MLVAGGVVYVAMVERSAVVLIGSGVLMAIAIAANTVNFARPEFDVWELGFKVSFNVIAVGAGLLTIGAVLLIRRIVLARPSPAPAD